MLYWLGLPLFFLIVFILPAIYIVPEWEKVAIIRFGKIENIVGTGLHVRIPIIDRIQRVDIRTQTEPLLSEGLGSLANPSYSQSVHNWPKAVPFGRWLRWGSCMGPSRLKDWVA